MANKFSISSTVKLRSGYELPVLGFGVYKTPADQATDCVRQALKIGYRHIDSATAYHNQGPSAEGIKAAGVPREDVFFTTKVPSGDTPLGYENVKKLVDAAIDETKLSYLDLVLIHWPHSAGPEGRKGAWRALVDAVEAKKVRSIGVSNFGVHHLDELESYIKELETERGPGKGGVISVGQWELHPWLTRPDIVKWCNERSIAIEAYCPIVRGQRLDDPKVQELAKKHGKTPAQILLRWSVQRGYVPLVKSVTPSRIEENAGIFDFALTDEEVEDLRTDEYSVCSWDPTIKIIQGQSATVAVVGARDIEITTRQTCVVRSRRPAKRHGAVRRDLARTKSSDDGPDRFAMPVQNTFTLITERIAKNNAAAETSRPMTSKQLKKQHQKANQGPKLSRIEQRKLELAEQERIRKELEKDRQQARARIARDKKKAKEEAQKEARRKKGRPLVDVRPSQDTISRFVRGNGNGKKRDGSGAAVGRIAAIAEEPEDGEAQTAERSSNSDMPKSSKKSTPQSASGLTASRLVEARPEPLARDVSNNSVRPPDQPLETEDEKGDEESEPADRTAGLPSDASPQPSSKPPAKCEHAPEMPIPNPSTFTSTQFEDDLGDDALEAIDAMLEGCSGPQTEQKGLFMTQAPVDASASVPQPLDTAKPQVSEVKTADTSTSLSYAADLGIQRQPSPPRPDPPMSTQAVLMNFDDYFPSPSQQERELEDDRLPFVSQKTPCPPPRPPRPQMRKASPHPTQAMAPPPSPKRFFSTSGSNELLSLAVHRSRRDIALENLHDQDRHRVQAGTNQPNRQLQRQAEWPGRSSAAGSRKQTAPGFRHTMRAPFMKRPAQGRPPAFKQARAPAVRAPDVRPPPFKPPAKHPSTGKENDCPPPQDDVMIASQETEYGGGWIDDIALDIL
ncbi:uncharacterized protein F5Z01DRAFT_628851 [Emericellopsis atlantica]|uniref:NADP-dependent oxidoreductase domain-containing protein n=1 Tax=Emericellopsis atlantica TaxID=2614577 RepID=A0A9P7ZEZ5_9HYPO|nr:uncharacterized protein F5Z01DRAFT_628851 [Emericellopsis atlantica]KAG9250721.1 hypothetical protein F5Z01DRAFT_628851 [Emericellopsis atlantica]